MEEKRVNKVNFLDLWAENFFLGEEFLTWLWINSELNNNSLNLNEKGFIEIYFENRLHLESGSGAQKRAVTCQSPDDKWAEAHRALRENKKLIKAKILIKQEENQWSFNLNADTIIPQAVKLPKTFASSEEDENDGQIGQFLERVFLLNELLEIMESLYKNFLNIRLSEKWENEELLKLRRWMAEQN